MRILSIEPIYGYGWLQLPTEEMRAVPAPFEAELITSDASSGSIITKGHEFEGGWVLFSPRHKDSGEYLNIKISQAHTPVAIGYARLLADSH